MLNTKPYITFIKYVIPSMVGLLAISSASIIDGYFIGNYVSALGLASINISHSIFLFIIGFALMFAVGCSVQCGKLLGEKNIISARNLFTQSIIAACFSSIIICLITYLSMNIILDSLNVKGELKVVTFEYISILLSFLPFLMLGIIVDYFVRVDENPILSSIALSSSALINVVLDYIFIVKFNWGISGAAYATGISQMTIILVLIPHFFTKKAVLKLIKPNGSWLNVLNGLKNGLSDFLNESSSAITIVIFNYIILKSFGVEGLSSYTIVGYFIMISAMISFGIADGLQPIISKNFGALLFNRIISFLKLGALTIIILEVSMTLLILLFPETLIGIFLKDNADFMAKKITIEFISYAWPAFLFIGLNILITSYLTSMQKPLYSLIIALLRSLILPILFIITLPLIFGNVGIFIALPLSEFITFIIAGGFFMKHRPSFNKTKI